ncbi:MAG: hypothetical protein UT94_C0006G0012 [Candidatus Uhrbacteria bacterium GW2011_GWF2_40_263]|nr:MAG: hypothetical protein UT94_C0006G0012 [Candidatus Uhrbacteria bacterium GW2011_GWF2_40_263]
MPFQATKITTFCLLIDLAFPLYLLFLLTNPENRPSIKNVVLISFSLVLFSKLFTSLLGIDCWNSFFGETIRIGGLFLQIHFFIFTLYLLLILKWKKFTFFLTVIKISALTAGSAAMYGLLEYLSIFPSLSESYLPRSSSLFGNPTYFASFLVIPFFFSLFLSIQTFSTRSVWFYRILSIVLFLGLLVSGTRGAFIGIIVGILASTTAVFFLQKKNWMQQKRLLIYTAGILILGIGLFGILRTTSSTKTLTYRITHFDSTTSAQRLYYWNMAIEGWKENPILGVGYENFYIISDTFFNPNLYEEATVWPDKPHNAFLEILTTGGILTLIFFTVFLIFIGRSLLLSWRGGDLDKKDSALLFGGFLAYLTQIVFSFDVFSGYLTFIFLVTFALFFSEPKQTNSHIKLPKLLTIMIPILIFLGVAMMITACYIPFIKDLIIAKNAYTTMEDDWLKAAEISKQIGSHGFIFDPHLSSKVYYDLLDFAIEHDIEEAVINDSLQSSLLSSYKKTTEEHPLRAKYWYEYAVIYIMIADLQNIPVDIGAFDSIQMVKTLAPNRVESFLLLSQIEEKKGNTDEAIRIAEEGLQIAPSHPQLLWVLASYYFNQNKEDEAAYYTYKALDHHLQIDDENIYYWLIDYYLQRNDSEKLAILYLRMITTFPDKLEHYPTLAAIYASLGDDENAEYIAKRLLKKDPNSKESVEAFLKNLKMKRD